MNPLSHRLRTDSTQTTQAASQSQAQVQEFASAEDLIRADAAGTAVPASVETRLAESIAREPAPTPQPWWKRLFR